MVSQWHFHITGGGTYKITHVGDAFNVTTNSISLGTTINSSNDADEDAVKVIMMKILVGNHVSLWQQTSITAGDDGICFWWSWSSIAETLLQTDSAEGLEGIDHHQREISSSMQPMTVSRQQAMPMLTKMKVFSPWMVNLNAEVAKAIPIQLIEWKYHCYRRNH